jgi:hypothetical protein
LIVNAKHIARSEAIDPRDGFTVAINVDAPYFVAGPLNLCKS